VSPARHTRGHGRGREGVWPGTQRGRGHAVVTVCPGPPAKFDAVVEVAGQFLASVRGEADHQRGVVVRQQAQKCELGAGRLLQRVLYRWGDTPAQEESTAGVPVPDALEQFMLCQLRRASLGQLHRRQQRRLPRRARQRPDQRFCPARANRQPEVEQGGATAQMQRAAAGSATHSTRSGSLCNPMRSPPATRSRHGWVL
jgi:hypothetical protein